jgi:hypothetical protein
MLWTDGDFITAADLLSEESEIQDDADALDISLTGNAGIIRRGIEEAGRWLENQLVSFTTYISSNDMSANHLAAVFYTGSVPNQRRRITLDQIVTSGRNYLYWSEVKIWAVAWVLKKFYITAANRTKEDKYSTKRDYYTDRLVKEMWPSLKQSGMPIVYRPMPAPDGAQLRNPGTWAVSTVSGSGTTTASYDVAISFTDSSRFLGEGNPRNQNGEGEPSQVQTVAITPGNVIQINIQSLNLPNGSVSLAEIARGFVVPLTADGFNIWVGPTGGTLYLQTPTPIPTSINSGTGIYALPADPVLSGVYSTAGNNPEPNALTGLMQGQYIEAFVASSTLIKRY